MAAKLAHGKSTGPVQRRERKASTPKRAGIPAQARLTLPVFFTRHKAEQPRISHISAACSETGTKK